MEFNKTLIQCLWPSRSSVWFLKLRYYLNDRHLGSEHGDDTHLEEESEGVTNVICMKLLEALSAVSALEEERVSHGSLGEALLEVAGLSGKHNRREGFQALEHRLELLLLRVFRELKSLFGLPAVHHPLCLALLVGYYSHGVVQGLDGPGPGPGKGGA